MFPSWIWVAAILILFGVAAVSFTTAFNQSRPPAAEKVTVAWLKASLRADPTGFAGRRFEFTAPVGRFVAHAGSEGYLQFPGAPALVCWLQSSQGPHAAELQAGAQVTVAGTYFRLTSVGIEFRDCMVPD